MMRWEQLEQCVEVYLFFFIFYKKSTPVIAG
jgi:hypothetical protein